MSQSLHWLWRIKRWYIRFMLAFLGHALAKASRSDPVISKELAPLPENFCFAMRVMPAGPALYMKKSGGSMKPITREAAGKPNVDIQFKHLEHAFSTLSFQEGTTDAFARERMIVDGDIPASMRLVRCFERLEAMTLPKLIARRIMRQYPALTLGEKLSGACRIYLGVLGGFVLGYK